MKTLAEVRAELNDELAEDAKDRKDKIRVNGAKLFIRQSEVLNDFDGDVKEAMKTLAGAGGRGGTSTRVSPKKAILTTLVQEGSMSDMDCFRNFNKGPAEMRDLMKYGIREVKAEDRVWITFEDGLYTVEAVGEETPDGWEGYEPVNSEEDL